MNKRLLLLLPLIAITVGVTWCIGLRIIISVFPYLVFLYDQIPRANPCSLPPDDFSESDLAGTWEAWRLGDTDTLIIREDGTYKQIIHIENNETPDVDYESEWQPWWLEYHESGIPYLHLEGMSFCAINPSLSCTEPTGYMGWHDFCEDETIAMYNEGILIVMGFGNTLGPGVTPPAPGVDLWFPMGSENTWTYHYQGP